MKISIEENKKYSRNNDDLICDLNIDLIEAIFGTNIQYTGFDGNLRSIDIKEGTQPEDKIYFKGMVKIFFIFLF